MGYTIGQISNILLKADRTMYKIGQIAYDDMFAEDSEALDYERDIIFIYKKAVEYGDDLFIGTTKLDALVEKLASKISVYDYGLLTPVYADVLTSVSNLVIGAAGLNDLTDVTISNILDNQILRYNATLGQWVNVAPGSAIRNSQTFIATNGQTVFTTSYPFDSGLFDVYLNGVRLNTSSYTTMGEYQITLLDGALVDDIIDVVIYDADTNILNPINSLSDLDDVLIGGLSNQQGLYFNTTSGKWENGAVFVPYTGAIANVNLGTFDLTADIVTANTLVKAGGTSTQILRADGQVYTFPLAISSPTSGQVLKYNGTSWVNDSDAGITGTGVAGQVAYWSGTGTQTGSNNLFWDATNNRLGIGTNTPLQALTLTGGRIEIQGSNSIAGNGISLGYFQTFYGWIQTWASLPLLLNGSGNNVIIGVGYTADNGNRLQVLGNAYVRGSGNTSATTALTVDNSDGTDLFTVLNNGYTRYGNAGNNAFRVYSSSVAGAGDVDLNGQFLTLNSRSGAAETGANAGFVHINGVTATGTTGIQNVLTIQKGFAPTSGNSVHSSLVVNPTINQTGGANGITRGLYVNPTLTAAADFRAIETTAGNVLFGSNFFWDNANNRLRINTQFAAGNEQNFNVYGSALFQQAIGDNSKIYIGNNTSLSTSDGRLLITPNRIKLNDRLTALIISADNIDLGANIILNGRDSDSGSLGLAAANNYALKIFGATRNIAIQNGGTFTDSGQRLQVTGDGYFSGSVGIGTNVLTGFSLRVNSNISGAATSFGISSSGQIQSGVTNARYYNAETNVAAGLTVDNTYGYVVVQGTFGAGSTVNNQYGFFASGSILNATNNYGFYGNIPLGNGRWNLYMGGDANNFLNGNTGLGVSPSAWGTTNSIKALQFASGSIWNFSNTNFSIGQNYYYDGANRVYVNTNAATEYSQINGVHRWQIAASGTAGNTFTFTQAMTLFGTGNLVLNSTTDSGQRLQVTGDTLLKGSGNTSATTALTVQNSSSQNAFRILNNGQINLGNSASLPVIRTVTEASVSVQDIAGTKLLFVSADTETGSNPSFRFDSNTLLHTSGNLTFAQFSRDFLPTSGTGTVTTLRIAGSINQTGGANGITRGLYVNPTLTAAADWRSIEWSNNTGWGLYGAGTSQNFLAGNLGIGTTTINNSALRVNKAITGAVTQSSIANSSTINSDVTTAAWMYVSSPSTQAAAFTLAEAVHFNAFNLTIGAGSTVTNQFGFRANSNLTAATNNYGFYGDIAAATGRWNLYMNGSASNYLNGGLVIGDTTALTGYNLRVNKQLGGATSAYGIASEPTFQAAVSSSGHGFFTSISLAASVSMVNLYHYRAQLSTLGAGSTITNQAAFLADGTITGATNNFGFQGGIAAGTGRWNAYMSGTAANYFNGNTIMGTLAADSGEKLQVNGTMKVTGASTFGGNMSLTFNQNASTGFTITNTTSGTASQSFINFVSDSSATSGAVGKNSTLWTSYKTLLAKDLYIYNASSGGGDISILNDFATGTIKFAAGGSSTAQWTIGSNGDLTAADGENIIVGTTNGTKLGTATSQKIGFWNATPIVQPTTAVAEATFVENSGGTAVNVDSTFAGYTLQQIAQALKNMGILA